MDLGANTNVIGHAGRTFAIVEAVRDALLVSTTPLASHIGSCADFDKNVCSGGYTAHPKRDPT